VRSDLVMEYKPGQRSALADDFEARDKLADDFTKVDFDFVLPPA
jgi:hypothetical protein